jgi:hypothetical protein
MGASPFAVPGVLSASAATAAGRAWLARQATPVSADVLDAGCQGAFAPGTRPCQAAERRDGS